MPRLAIVKPIFCSTIFLTTMPNIILKRKRRPPPEHQTLETTLNGPCTDQKTTLHSVSHVGLLAIRLADLYRGGPNLSPWWRSRSGLTVKQTWATNKVCGHAHSHPSSCTAISIKGGRGTRFFHGLANGLEKETPCFNMPSLKLTNKIHYVCFLFGVSLCSVIFCCHAEQITTWETTAISFSQLIFHHKKMVGNTCPITFIVVLLYLNLFLCWWQNAVSCFPCVRVLANQQSACTK